MLADRNFAAQNLIAKIARTGADLLIRTKNGRNLPVCRRLLDGSYVSRIGSVEVRVIRATVTIVTSAGRSSEAYTLVSSILDSDCPAQDLIGLYHERWEIETSFLEIKSTILGGRVLRARTPGGVDQEVYALLVTYQAASTLNSSRPIESVGSCTAPPMLSFTPPPDSVTGRRQRRTPGHQHPELRLLIDQFLLRPHLQHLTSDRGVATTD